MLPVKWHGFHSDLMMSDKINPSDKGRLPEAETGNASNPSPHNRNLDPVKDQMLNEKAENYLRESGNIEDEPDAQDQQDADQLFNAEK